VEMLRGEGCTLTRPIRAICKVALPRYRKCSFEKKLEGLPSLGLIHVVHVFSPNWRSQY